jgi:hypothetical protein
MLEQATKPSAPTGPAGRLRRTYGGIPLEKVTCEKRGAFLRLVIAASVVLGGPAWISCDAEQVLAADTTIDSPVQSAEWLLEAIRREGAVSGAPLTTEELQMLRTPVPELFSLNLDREQFRALNDKVVRLARSGMERAKAAGAPTVVARPRLRIPADWFRHYTAIFSSNLDWVLSGVLQNAMIANPGETAPWESR